MLIKFTKGGRGSGAQVAEYLTRSEGRDHAPPEVVRGDMARTRELIDSIERQWSYTHGVLSFAAEDAPTEAEQHKAMDMFERLAFAGLDREQYDITWVRHSHTETGRTELHFVTPRIDLNSGRAMNIAPPGWESTYRPLRDALNYEHGWARPDDPERAQELTQAPQRAFEGFQGREPRAADHEHLTGLIAAHAVTDRASMVLALEEAGLQVPRQGRDYLTVMDPESGDKFRMKGRIYEKDWTYDRELERAIAPERGDPDERERADHQRRAREAREQYQAAVERRAGFNSERYRRHELEDQRGPEVAELGKSLLVDRADPDVADRGRLISLALDAPSPASRADVRKRRVELSRAAGRIKRDNLQAGRSRVSMRETAGGDVSHEREADDIRAGFARTVRDLGSRLRDRLGKLQGYVREASGSWRELGQHFAGLARSARAARKEPEPIEQSLGRTDAAHQALEGAIGRLGDTGQRVAGRVSEMTQEREARERAEQYRSRSKDYGFDL